MSTGAKRIPLIKLPIDRTATCLGCLEVIQESKRIALPLSEVDISAKVGGRVAQVTVRQTFRNDHKQHLQAVYIFPLSGSSAVSDFELRVNDRVIKGAVQERQAARQEYAQAIQDGKRAALLEQERDDIFTVTVGNLPPGEEVSVVVTYSERLPYFENGATELRLPTVIGDRYIPGHALNRPDVGKGTKQDTDAVPDASRITPPRLAPGAKGQVNLSIAVELIAEDGQKFSDLACSQHATSISVDGGSLKVELARDDERLNRDFILRWSLAQETTKSSLLVYRKDGQAYGMLTLIPPKRDGYLGAPRDVLFLLDRSGSMTGPKMASAARACSLLLSTLGPEDKFAICAFDDTCEWLLPQGTSRSHNFFHQADEQEVERGQKFLRGIEARGGTALNTALKSCFEAIGNRHDDDGRIPVLVVLTDGEVGNESEILKRVQNDLKETRLFCVGIDTAVNSGLLTRLARLGGGAATFVEPGTQLENALTQVAREIGAPLVTDIEVKAAAAEKIEGLTPSSVPDLFAGRASTVFFKLDGKSPVAISGSIVDDGSTLKEEVTAQEVDMPAIAHLWARSRVVDLEDEFRLKPALQQALSKAIIELAVKHSILCRFTAYVVVDEAEVVNQTGQLKEVVQPVEMPHLWQSLGAPAAPAQARSMLRSMSRQQQGVDDSLAQSLGRIRELETGAPQPACDAEFSESGGSDCWSASPEPQTTSSFRRSQNQAPQSPPPPPAPPGRASNSLMGNLMGSLFGKGDDSDAIRADITGTISFAEREKVAKQTKELFELLRKALAEIEAGKVPAGKEIEKRRSEVLRHLSQSALGSELALLQKFMRGALVELIASLAAKDTTAAQLLGIWQRHLAVLPDLQDEVTNCLAGAGTASGGKFWETGV